jgi:hypothetical protein
MAAVMMADMATGLKQRRLLLLLLIRGGGTLLRGRS